MEINYTIENIAAIAQNVVNNLTSNTILLYGNMGVGKTTLVKHLVKCLGSNDEVSSPTFSIVNEYETNTDTLVYHFDLYRIKDIEEAYNFGIEDYLYSENYKLIEWPELIEKNIDDHFNRIDIVMNPDNSRTLKLH
ncbi:tRNA (adenosine(37)-N6)-threonylcarbamoyltransferase complex ATPase subunit type 1 TsaE [Seonamhaeicola algicola]|uniref:tRNA threonylcarbamoyladenosine biosynthesis protein TsaE n=1 Tax=Seonamhaeicola algicola TaxID=1719036 RepID=A0A5C7ASH7_9FLAO|nr:tRNA (adenosine(37)-N6)-threonylcarbamoyltransferase complex ATPase subunit type 1 TsaE [Seonamhaeicola algicola]TXE11640.1 tRNA (adenosine(37)-N6)-threonylcarbamoyltransferase complex ATPase subunit type 1 TsaE [Seonamhaeicola algicola]